MKKVNNYLSSEQGQSFLKKCIVVFSIAAASVIFVTAAYSFSFFGKTASGDDFRINCDRRILQLSDSYLSPNSVNSISVIELPSQEDENIGLISPEAESAAAEETMTAAQENTSEEVGEQSKQEIQTTQPETTTADELPGAFLPGYSFEELGLTQMSEIPVPETLRFDENGVPLNYRYTLTGKSTTYTMGTMTATGTSVHPGVIAVNPKIIPYGTKMYIVASDGSGHVYGYSSAEDTGGFIYWDNGPLVDMYVNCYADAVAWGNKPVTIYIL